MSDLEQRAEPILSQMIRGEHVRLNRAQQVIVSTWATKTAMVIEPTLTMLDNFTAEQCAIVRTRDHPPGSVVVYIAAMDGPIAPMGYWGAKVHLILGDSPFRDFHFHTIHVGPLVMQVLRMEPPPAGYGALEPLAVPREFELPFEMATVVFVPTGNCPWPPRRVLDWDGLVALTRRGIDMPQAWAPPGPHWMADDEAP